MEFFETDAFLGVGAAEFGHDAEFVLPEWEEGEESIGVVEKGEFVLGEGAGDFDIGQAEEVGVGCALKIEAEGMAHGAVGAITSDDVVVADFTNDALGVLDAGANDFGFGVEFEEFGRAFDEATEADEFGFEELFGFELRENVNAGKGALQLGEIEFGEGFGFVVESDAFEGMGLLEEGFGPTVAGEEFEGAGVNAEGTRGFGAAGGLVDEAAVNAEAAERESEEEAAGSRADNEDARLGRRGRMHK